LKHVGDSNKRVIEEIVRQVGYLPELYEDVRSEKYEKTKFSALLSEFRLTSEEWKRLAFYRTVDCGMLRL